MSTLKTINIQHPSASAAAMTLNSDGTLGNASFANYPGRNRIINGGFAVWQRGTSFTGFGTPAYTADRWLAVSNTATYTVTRQDAGSLDPIGSVYYARCSTTVAGVYDFSLCQPIESSIFDSLKGQTVTLSFYARASTALSLDAIFNRDTSEGKVYYYQGTTVSSTTFNLTTSWARYSVTFNMPAKSITNKGFQINFRTSMTLGQYFDLWGVQLETGTIATPFEFKSYGQELRECQRYFYTTKGTRFSGGMFATGSGQWIRSTLTFPVTMRATPDITANWDDINTNAPALLHRNIYHAHFNATSNGANINAYYSASENGNGIQASAEL